MTDCSQNFSEGLDTVGESLSMMKQQDVSNQSLQCWRMGSLSIACLCPSITGVISRDRCNTFDEAWLDGGVLWN